MKKITTILSSYLRAKKMSKIQSRVKLEKYQQKKLRQHLAFLASHSPYFKDMSDFEKLPLMDKKVMMEHFDELNTKSITKKDAFKVALEAENSRNFSPKIGDVTVGLSSGTSGNRGLFLVSDDERFHWAGTILAKLLPDTILKKETIAFFLRANSNLYEAVESNHIQFVFFDLVQEMDDHIKKLNVVKPSILAAPPSVMKILAKKKREGTLQIRPKRIITMAEVLEPLDEDYIKESFGQIVHQVYQCTEGFLATTCTHGTLHLNEDIVYIEKEFLDEEKSRFYPIITDFNRTTQPIVRYRLNDILILKKEPCPCRSAMTTIEKIEGRSDDVFYFKHAKEEKHIPVFSDFIRRCVMVSSNEIQEYRIIQHDFHSLEVQLLTSENKQDIQQKVSSNLTQYLLSREVVLPSITFTDYKEKEKLAKLKRIQRNFSLDGNR